MITVVIYINGQPIHARSAVNKGEAGDGKHRYAVDDGSVILHRRGNGAVALAIQMLKGVRDDWETERAQKRAPTKPAKSD